MFSPRGKWLQVSFLLNWDSYFIKIFLCEVWIYPPLYMVFMQPNVISLIKHGLTIYSLMWCVGDLCQKICINFGLYAFLDVISMNMWITWKECWYSYIDISINTPSLMVATGEWKKLTKHTINKRTQKENGFWLHSALHRIFFKLKRNKWKISNILVNFRNNTAGYFRIPQPSRLSWICPQLNKT